MRLRTVEGVVHPSAGLLDANATPLSLGLCKANKKRREGEVDEEDETTKANNQHSGACTMRPTRLDILNLLQVVSKMPTKIKTK